MSEEVVVSTETQVGEPDTINEEQTSIEVSDKEQSDTTSTEQTDTTSKEQTDTTSKEQTDVTSKEQTGEELWSAIEELRKKLQTLEKRMKSSPNNPSLSDVPVRDVTVKAKPAEQALPKRKLLKKLKRPARRVGVKLKKQKVTRAS